jgi:hypothetical protein
VCAYDFELSINDIANTHRTWSQDRTSLSSGELTLKEVMQIWRNKFPKQEISVFSVQIKECRRYMDRQREELFNDVVAKLSSHFGGQDELVSKGKMSYSTTPRRNFSTPFNDRATAQHTSPRQFADTATKFDRKFDKRQRPNEGAAGVHNGSKFNKADRTAPSPRPVVKGHLRGLSCGSNTNHYGLGCHKHTCVFFNTKHDRNKNGHVWKDSDKEPAVDIPRPEYTKLLKDNPQICEKLGCSQGQSKES